MRQAKSTEENTRKELIKLYNTIHWDRHAGDKVYLQNVQLAISNFPFQCRQVHLRFAGGPDLDACLVDMDRLVLGYLKLRRVRPPRQLCKLAEATPPPPADFLIPGHLAAKLPRPQSSRPRA